MSIFKSITPQNRFLKFKFGYIYDIFVIMSDETTNSIAQAKIHILYLVDKVPGVSYHMLMDGCMQSLFVEYFAFAQAYEELIAGNLMKCIGAERGKEDTIGATDTLTLTDGGRAVLADIKDALNDKLRSTLNAIADELSREFADSSRISVTKTPVPGGIRVDLSYKGDRDSLSASITVKTPEEAESAINRWRRECIDITDKVKDQLISNS